MKMQKNADFAALKCKLTLERKVIPTSGQRVWTASENEEAVGKI